MARVTRELCLPISVRRAQMIVSSVWYMKHRMRKKRPLMTARHKQMRLEWARKMLKKSQSWGKKVVFSDEKNLILTVLMGTDITGTTSEKSPSTIPSGIREVGASWYGLPYHTKDLLVQLG